MYSPNQIIRTISLIGAFILAATTARAVIPAPDGGYANDNTAEGENALFSLTTGASNSASKVEEQSADIERLESKVAQQVDLQSKVAQQQKEIQISQQLSKRRVRKSRM